MSQETEPDYRFTLANERTHLAWMRTALGLLAGSVIVAELAPRLLPNGGKALALLLAVVSIITTIGATHRWLVVQRAMRRNVPLSPSRMPWVLAICLTAFGGFCVALVVMQS